MPQIAATTSEQVQKFLDENGGVAIVDCHATWCGPCRAIYPYVHDKSVKTGIPLIKIDVDQAPDLAQEYGVQAMPTFLLISKQWNIVDMKVIGGGETNVNKIFQKSEQLRQ